MLFKKLSSIFLGLIILLSLVMPNNANAHKSTCINGSESVGWIVNCDSHAGKSSYIYKFDIGLSSAYQGYTLTGVSRWNSTGIVYISPATTSTNLVTSHGGSDTSTVAVTRSWKNSTTGHKTRWEFSYNRYVMGNRTATQNNETATHEIGHTIGLADLYKSYNNNKLMYGTSSRTVYSQLRLIKLVQERQSNNKLTSYIFELSIQLLQSGYFLQDFSKLEILLNTTYNPNIY